MFTLTFRSEQDGICCTADNELRLLKISVTPNKRAVWNDTSIRSCGYLQLRDIQTIGRVQILGRDQTRNGHVEIRGLHVAQADSRGESEQPKGYGVRVVQGAFTLWNMQATKDSVLTANLQDISIGRPGSPVLGTGLFVCGGENAGTVEVEQLTIGAVYANGMIPAGTADQISGGVFVLYGARVDVVRNFAPVVTLGSNDMALDNWGTVDRWFVQEKVTTTGPSAIGFVNFGTIGSLQLDAPIETFGPGARGFNVYAGTVRRAEFDRIVTHGDGAVGVQISQPIGQLRVRRGIETFGGTGPSLVKGVLTQLAAVALSIKPGGSVQRLTIAGGLKAHGVGVAALEQEGVIDSLSIEDGFLGHRPAAE